jgi:hypothetical protein
MYSAGLGALCAPSALHWGDAGCDADVLPEARRCYLVVCSSVVVQHDTLLSAAPGVMLPCVACAALMFWQQLQDSFHCLRVGVTIQLTFTLGDLHAMLLC